MNISIDSTYIYFIGILCWPMIYCYLLGSYKKLFKNWLLYTPFLLCLLVISINLILVRHYQQSDNVQLEEYLFQFLDNRSSNIMNAISSILVISAVAYGVGDRKFPEYFLRFISATFVAIIGFTTPIIWIPITKQAWMPILRAYQTVPFTYGIFFAIAAILLLLKDVMNWMGKKAIDSKKNPSI